MEDHQPPLSAEKIIERIASDKALHDVLQPLLEEVRELRKELGQLQNGITGGPAPRYLTIPEVAEMFGVCAETVRRRARAGEWPAAVIGRQTRFGPEEIAAIRQSLIKPAPGSLPPGSWERRQRNKRNRVMLPGRG